MLQEPNFEQSETLTVTLPSDTGSLSLAGNFTQNGNTYTDIGSASDVINALQAMTFTPNQGQPGQSVTTTFTIQDVDSAGESYTNSNASVTNITSPEPLIILGGFTRQFTTNQTPLYPLANVLLLDPNFEQTETLTVRPMFNTGSLIHLNGFTETDGVYTDIGTAEDVNFALHTLVFVPNQEQPGQSVITTFIIHDVDNSGESYTTNTSVLATGTPEELSLIGGAAGQSTANQMPLHPFTGAALTDPNFEQTETLTVTPTLNTGSLTNLGDFTETNGVYTDIGTAGNVSEDLAGLLFTPIQGLPGQSVTTTFTILDQDTAGQTATNNETTITNITGTLLPTITGVVAPHITTDRVPVSPFAGVTIADDNLNQTETVTVTMSSLTNGSLSDLGDFTPGVDPGSYTEIGSAAAVSTDLDALVFIPEQGQSATTTFTINDVDSAGASAIEATTSVIAQLSSRPVDNFSGGTSSDILYQSTTGYDIGYAAVLDGTSQGDWSDYGPASAAYTVAGVGDFNGSGVSDILFRDNATGDTGYLANTANDAPPTWIDLGVSSTAYTIVGNGDFNGDGTSDLLFRSGTTGDMGMYLLNANGPNTWQDLGTPSLLYSVVGIGDFTGNGKAGILFEDTANGSMGYYMPDAHGGPGTWVGLGSASTAYSVAGVGDFNGDGTADILFRNNTTGDAGYLAMPTGNGQATWVGLGVSSTAYSVVAVGDFAGNGTSNILFRDNATGDTGYYVVPHGNAAGIWQDLGASSTAYHVVASPTYGAPTSTLPPV